MSLHLRVVGLLMALAFGIAPTGTRAAPVFDNVRIMFQPFAGSGALFVAEREGYFERQGIRITWVPFNAQDQAIPVLAQGQLDVAFGLTPAFFNVVARGEPLRIVADRGHVTRGNNGSLLVRKDLAGVVRSVADLKGRRVALAGSFGGPPHYWLVRALANVGLTFDQVSAVFIPVTAILAALQSGAVDAGFMANPLDTLAQEKGIAFKLLDVADIVPAEHTSFLTYGRTLVLGNRPLGVRVMVAYLQGIRRFSEGPTPRNIAIIAEYTKTDPETIRKGGWVSIHPDGYVDLNRTRRYQDWLYEIELISVRSPMSALLDLYFVEQARAILGIPPR